MISQNISSKRMLNEQNQLHLLLIYILVYILKYCQTKQCINICLLQLKFKVCYQTITTYLNKRMKPYVSIHMPTRGQPRRTTVMPPRKAHVAFTLCL